MIENRRNYSTRQDFGLLDSESMLMDFEIHLIFEKFIRFRWLDLVSSVEIVSV